MTALSAASAALLTDVDDLAVAPESLEALEKYGLADGRVTQLLAIFTEWPGSLFRILGPEVYADLLAGLHDAGVPLPFCVGPVELVTETAQRLADREADRLSRA